MTLVFTLSKVNLTLITIIYNQGDRYQDMREEKR
jgi:hypothetical protein